MNITISQIIAFLGIVVSVWGSIEFILKRLVSLNNKKKLEIQQMITESLKPLIKSQNEIIKKIDDLDNKVDKNELEAIKNYLTKCFNDLRQGQVLSEANKQRVYEQMEIYTNMGGNSYIHTEFESLKSSGLL